MEWLLLYQVNVPEVRQRYLVVKNYPFDSVRKTSSIVIPYGEGYRRYYKGASEVLLERCTRVIDLRGDVVDIAPFQMELSGTIDSFTCTGLRTVSMCYEEIAELQFEAEDANHVIDPPEVKNLVFVGVVAMKVY